MTFSVREIKNEDIELITAYWLGCDEVFLEAMGADITRIPVREEWVSMLSEQLNTPIEKKKSYAIIWLIDGNPVGHCNINQIVFGDEAHMHLHLWNSGVRQKGAGTELVKITLPWFFEKCRLKKLYCEPYALNPAPNKVLEKVGFEFVKTYVTTPGWLNFEQPVNLWEMSSERFRRNS